MKAPKDLAEYTNAEDAALYLEELARLLRIAAERRPFVKCYVKLNFWNPAWLTTTRDKVLERIEFKSKRGALVQKIPNKGGV